MVASDEMDGVGVLDLEGQQQADGLQAVSAPVHIIPQEQVVDVRDVSRCAGRAILLEQPHQIPKLAMQVSKYLDRRCKPHLSLGIDQRITGHQDITGDA